VESHQAVRRTRLALNTVLHSAIRNLQSAIHNGILAPVSAPKSAYELAMERLRQKDAEAGDVREAVSDEQKAEIAEVRSRAEARIAELKILHQSKVLGIFDPDAHALVDGEFRRDIQRIEEDREARIAKIRGGSR
jgi:hypothetical protein